MATPEEIEKYRDLIAEHDTKIATWIDDVADTIQCDIDKPTGFWNLAEKYLASPDYDGEVSMFLRAAKSTVGIEKDGSICITDNDKGWEYYYTPKPEYGDLTTVETTAQRVVDAVTTWAEENDLTTDPTTRTYTFTVDVTTDTLDHAHQVMTERLGHDEELTDELGETFDYRIEPARLTVTPENADR